MKIESLLFSIFALSVVFSCSRGALATDTNDDDTATLSIPADTRPGLIRVKLENEPTTIPEDGIVYIGSLGECTVSPTFSSGGKFEERHRKYGLHLWYDIKFNEDIPLTRASGELKDNLTGIKFIEFDSPVKYDSAPFDDPMLPYQWHYNNDGTNALNAVEGCDINLFEAWEISTGSPNVIVAIIDGGVDYDHEDLAQNMWINEAEINGTRGVDDDGNGYTDDIYGYNFLVNHKGGTITAVEHGTHVAGTVAAVNNNGIGVSGVAGGNGSITSGVRLMSCQTNSSEEDESAYIGEAIVYAADNGAVLANCSWSTNESEALKESIIYFNECAGTDENGNQTGPMKGGLMLFAAGNENTTTCFPAEIDEVFAVAAVGPNYSKAYYSNYGSWVDITAPGGDAQYNALVRSILPDNEYGTMQGTSMACPHVAGVAALVVSYFGGDGFTREKLINILTNTANPIIYETSYNSSFYSGKLGTGLVDAYAALTATSTIPDPVENLHGSANANTITIGWSLPSNSANLPDKINIYYSTSSLSSIDTAALPQGVTKVTTTVDDKTAEAKMTYKISGLAFSTDYHFRIERETNLGTVSVLSDELIVATTENNAPTIEAVGESSISLKSHEKGSLTFNVSDPNEQELSCSLSDGLDGASISLSEGVVTVSIDASKAEEDTTYTGTVSVSDGFESASADISYTILPNNAPVSVKSMENIVFSSKSESASFNLGEYFSDPDGETPTYSVATDGSGVQATIVSSALKLSAKAYGTYSVTVTASDNRAKTASQVFSVLVRDGSKPFDIYPNPVTDYVNIRTGEDKTAGITIYNKAGATVYENDAATFGPFSPLSVDMSSLSGGVYYIKINNGTTENVYSIAKK